jgi:hypothetical protein
LTNREVARKLRLADGTVKIHVHHILQKLDEKKICSVVQGPNLSGGFGRSGHEIADLSRRAAPPACGRPKIALTWLLQIARGFLFDGNLIFTLYPKIYIDVYAQFICRL